MYKLCRQLILRLLYIFCICLLVALCVSTYRLHNDYVIYIVAMRLYRTSLDLGRLV